MLQKNEKGVTKADSTSFNYLLTNTDAVKFSELVHMHPENIPH